MSLPTYTDNAALRALDARCESRHSADCKRTVAQLSSLTPDLRKVYSIVCMQDDLGNLLLCAISAGHDPNDIFHPEVGYALPAIVSAAGLGRARALKALLDGGANHAATDSRGATALMMSSRSGHVKCVRLLLDAGADPHAVDTLGSTALMNAVTAKHAECCAALLPVSNIATINSRMGLNVFHASVLTASEECFKLLLPLVPDVDVRTVPGTDSTSLSTDRTALHLAALMGQQPMAKALIKRGAARMARDSGLATPLHAAAERGHLSCAVLLLSRPSKMSPAEVDAVNDHGYTPLHSAAYSGFEKIVGVLLEAGARLDAKTTVALEGITAVSGVTPLMIAQQFHPTNAALLALLSGAAGPTHLPGTVCDHCGKTPAQANVNILKACGNCHAARFCGADCAAAAWPAHKAACRARLAEVKAATKPVIVERNEKF